MSASAAPTRIPGTIFCPSCGQPLSPQVTQCRSCNHYTPAAVLVYLSILASLVVFIANIIYIRYLLPVIANLEAGWNRQLYPFTQTYLWYANPVAVVAEALLALLLAQMVVRGTMPRFVGGGKRVAALVGVALIITFCAILTGLVQLLIDIPSIRR